jgi:hypothetical protein
MHLRGREDCYHFETAQDQAGALDKRGEPKDLLGRLLHGERIRFQFQPRFGAEVPRLPLSRQY